MRLGVPDLELRHSAEAELAAPATTPNTSPDRNRLLATRPAPPLELDLRGQTVEAALRELERYVDAAFYAGLPWVRIIHGKGSGRLRQSVRAFLKDCPLVHSQSAGREEEGGEGVTVAHLAV